MDFTNQKLMLEWNKQNNKTTTSLNKLKPTSKIAKEIIQFYSNNNKKL